ncbi:uncharacterized protein [Diabrotica undecimpunctata]|uniref:uncharacterized protein isoform X1 n=1 Tax=Diabrotica undecimpunctata TaxID=50387 RepID=UPI003B632EA5
MKYNVIACVVVSLLGLFVCSTAKEGELNEHCTLGSECRRPAYLCGRNRTCQCMPNYRPNKYWDKCVGIVGERCKYDEHCIEGGFCKDQKICECKDYLVASEDNTECSLPVVSDSTRISATKYAILPVLVLLYLKLYLWIG